MNEEYLSRVKSTLTPPLSEHYLEARHALQDFMWALGRLLEWAVSGASIDVVGVSTSGVTLRAQCKLFPAGTEVYLFAVDLPYPGYPLTIQLIQTDKPRTVTCGSKQELEACLFGWLAEPAVVKAFQTILVQ